MNRHKTIHLKSIWLYVFGCVIIFTLSSILTFCLLSTYHGDKEISSQVATKTKSHKQGNINEYDD